jgi:ribosomal protein S18 acetylase RimI-like enzyme
MATVVRPATRDDCRILAYHAYLAGKSHVDKSVYDVMIPGIGGPTDARLSAIEKILQTDTVSWIHYTFCSVAEVDGTVVGSLSHYTTRDGADANILAALLEAGWEQDDMKEMGQRLKPLFDIDFTKPPQAMIIENVAVSPMFRRHGILSALLDDAEHLARAGGFEFMQLGMMVGNTRARKAYEDSGFEVVETRISPDFEKLFNSPGMQLLKRKLS